MPRTPFALSFAVLKKDASVAWFINPDRLSSDLQAHLGSDVEIIPPQDMKTYLEKLTGNVLVVAYAAIFQEYFARQSSGRKRPL